MQQAICPARPQPIPRPATATPTPAPAFASLGDSLPDMNLALATVRAQAPTTPAPTPAPAGAQHDPCPNCQLPHKPGNPCRPAAGNGGNGGSDGNSDAGNGRNSDAPAEDADDGQDRAAQLLDLLTAIRDALDIPHAATTGHDETRTEILTRRIRHTVVALGNVLDEGAPLGIPWETAYLRDRLAEHPAVGYVTDAQARAALDEGATWADAVTLPAPPACGRCDRTLDPADGRHDGHARHKGSPWCRRCIDQCHDGGADHVCVICNPARYGQNGTAT